MLLCSRDFFGLRLNAADIVQICFTPVNFTSNSNQLRLAEIIHHSYRNLFRIRFKLRFRIYQIRYKSLKSRSGAAQSRTSAAEILAGAGERAPHRQNY